MKGSCEMETLLKRAEELQERLVSWRRTVHRYAEPGGEEHRTAALVEHEAKRLGLPVIDGCQTSRIAVLDTGRPG